MKQMTKQEFQEQYMTTPEIEPALTKEEMMKDYPSLCIDWGELGMDRGIMFNTVAVKISKIDGRLRVSEYLPSPGTGRKKADFYIVVKGL